MFFFQKLYHQMHIYIYIMMPSSSGESIIVFLYRINLARLQHGPFQFRTLCIYIYIYNQFRPLILKVYIFCVFYDLYIYIYSVVFAYIYIYMIYNKLRCFAEGLTCFGYVYIYIYIYIYVL